MSQNVLETMEALKVRVARMESQLDSIPALVAEYKTNIATLQEELAKLPNIGDELQKIVDDLAAHSDKFDAAMKPVEPAPVDPSPAEPAV